MTIVFDWRRLPVETIVSGIALRRAVLQCWARHPATKRSSCAGGSTRRWGSSSISIPDGPCSTIAKIVGRLLALLDATKITLRQLRKTMVCCAT
jgi:hypothetical protein